MADIRKDNNRTFLKVRGKGNKERQVLMNNSCLDAYEKYLEERSKYPKIKDDAAVFISPRTGSRLSARAIEYIVEKSLKESGLEGRGYSAHKLRHTTATKMFQEGLADTLTIGRILGHSSPSSTQIYAHGSVNQIIEAMEHTQFTKADDSEK